ncbi:EamA family transporter [Cohnella nanjingensis]|uniref:EamA family transporter n=1 Tax=Cohnella nanjingensis TaxID=1387779 RepID=A0A7X0RPN1_9BACL|nr:EamA family transporter [Cohnella nanjingensis]
MVLFNYAFMCLIFGTTFLAIKVGVSAEAPPFFLAGIRFLAAGAILFLWMALRGKARFGLLLRKALALSGFCLTFVTFAALYWAEQYVSSGIAAVLSATGPMMILVLQAVVWRQRTSLLSAAGCAVGFAGVVLIMLPHLAEGAHPRWWIGSGVVLLGEAGYALGAIYAKSVTQRHASESPIAINAVQMAYGGLMLLALSAFTERVPVGALADSAAAGSLLYLTVVGSMFGHSLFYWLVARTNPVFPATWLYVSPPIALAVGALFLNERVAWISGLGVATVMAGTALANGPTLKRLLRRPSPDGTRLPSPEAARNRRRSHGA